MNMHDDVKAFFEKMQQPYQTVPGFGNLKRLQDRIEFLQEELNELITGKDQIDLPLVADALVDLVYVALGGALILGLPWQQLWDDVHRANMAKVPGATHRVGHGFDAKKPPGWVPPKTLEILVAAGFVPPAKADELPLAGEG